MKTFSVTFDLQVRDEVEHSWLMEWVEEAVKRYLWENEVMGNLEIREVAE